MKDSKDPIVTIAIVCKDYTAFQNWRKEHWHPGGSCRVIYVDPVNLEGHGKGVRFDGLITLPCADYHLPEDLVECKAFVRSMGRASIRDFGDEPTRQD
jgi:hypothetical protein